MTDIRPVRIRCEGYELVGVLDLPQQPSEIGVLIVVGGPQYRVGSHRQFVLLARYLASNGVAAMRFDHRGVGDSEGEDVSFDEIDPDIGAAIDTFLSTVPQIRRVVIWGLCDAASAAMIYAHTDSRVTGLVLLNPWVRSVQGLAKTYMKRYYVSRFLSKLFWQRVRSGDVDIVKSAKSFIKNTVTAYKPVRSGSDAGDGAAEEMPYQQRMEFGLREFGGRVLFILSGQDVTAREFETVTNASRGWRKIIARPTTDIRRLPDSNHTFGQRKWRDQVAAWTLDWLRSS